MIEYHNIEQRSFEWHQAKLGKLGGSTIKSIVDIKNKMLLKQNHIVLSQVAAIIAEIDTGFSNDPEFTNDAIEWGIETEDEAISTINYPDTFQTGGVTDPEFPYFWLSPDLLSKDKGFEVKCFTSKNFAKIVILGKMPTEHLPQCISYMALMPELDSVDFIVYDPRFKNKQKHVITLNRCDYLEEIYNMRDSIKTFCGLVDEKLKLFGKKNKEK